MFKRFSQSLFNDNDPQTRKVVKKYWRSVVGIEIKNNSKKYGADLIAGPYFIEVDRVIGWKKEEWPFKDIHILERKRKFFASGKCWYCGVSNDFKRMVIIHPKVVRKYMKPKYQYENPNALQSGEMVYGIPLAEAVFVDLVPKAIKPEDIFIGYEEKK